MEDKITLYPVTAPFCSSGSSHCMTMVLAAGNRNKTSRVQGSLNTQYAVFFFDDFFGDY